MLLPRWRGGMASCGRQRPKDHRSFSVFIVVLGLFGETQDSRRGRGLSGRPGLDASERTWG